MRQARIAGPGGASARVVLTAFFKDKWKLAAAFLLTLGAAVGLAFLVTPTYEANALLYVKFGREYTYRAQSGASEIVTQAFDREQLLRSEAAILVAADTAAAVVKKIGATRLYPQLAHAAPEPGVPPVDPDEQAREIMLANLDTEAGDESTIISVTFRHPDRALAAEVLEDLVEAYIAKRRPLFADLQAKKIEAETRAAKAELDRTENELEQFEQDNGIVLFESERGILLDQQGGLVRALQAAESDHAATNEQAARLRASLDEVEPTVVLEAETQRNPVLADAQRALLNLRLRDAELRNDWQNDSPPVAQVRQGIAAGERMMGELGVEPERLVRTGINPLHAGLTSELNGVVAQASAEAARKTVIAKQLADTRAQIAALSANERRLNNLTLDRDLASAAYKDLSRRLDEARLLDKLALEDDANVRVLQQPYVPLRPNDLTPLIVMAGLMGAVFMTLTTAFVSDLLRSSYLTPEQLERATGLPVLGVVPLKLGRR